MGLERKLLGLVGTRERSVGVATWLYSLGTMNIPYYQSMSSEFRYVLEKVLNTQDRPTLILASHHCVLRPNLIKNMFNTCIYTQTHTSIHLSIQSWHHSSQNTYPSLKQKRAKHKGNPNINLTYEKPYHTSMTR